MQKTDIKNYDLAGLENIITKNSQPKYRARQLFKWLFQKSAKDFVAMTDLPRGLLEELEKGFFISKASCSEKCISRDGTTKLLFGLEDGHFVETVVIPSRTRNTICLSTQAGCRFRCAFCASGMRGFFRNLTTAEILNQIIYVRDTLKTDITNYVFMGMGEPLDNYDNLITALKIMNHKDGLNIGARRITVSTCGITAGIKKLGNFDMQVNLSLSLHAVTDKTRSSIMPVNKRYPIEPLVAAVDDYIEKTGRMITLEYILIPGVNDSISDAVDLANIARYLRGKINLIPYSHIPGLKFKPPDRHLLELFLNRVKQRHAHIILRESKGKDIHAACGQLAGKKPS
jgi:23S rRNA (adenine2503-C2)-methyltransferase